MKFRFTFKKLILTIFVILVILIVRPVGFLTYTYFKDKKSLKYVYLGKTKDASNLNETTIDSIVRPSKQIDEAIHQISELIKQAKVSGKKISIAGAQHSMGGHTIYPNGILLDMKPFNYMELDSSNNVLLVGSGALWGKIIPYLDHYGKSVSIMQSNNSFSVGGSVSVNCHGWQLNSPPISSTVISLRLINANGEVVNCSRTENQQLFSLVLGGYGLFGVILDLKLKVVDNKTYKVQQAVIKSKDYVVEFEKLTKNNSNIGLAYGRINVNPDHFMEEAILSVYLIEKEEPAKLNNENTYSAFRRTLFRGSANSNYGKNLRWKMEKGVVSLVNGKRFTRNRILNEGVEVFENRDTDFTDILHEYFIPKESVSMFIERIQNIIPRYKVDLLNITLRNVKKDNDTYLNYARTEVFGFVMLFNQERNKTAEAEMSALTRELIGVAASLKGTYYLPYRLHSTKAQMLEAYPQASVFFGLKRTYDPQEIFNNQFYKAYGN
ncbi:FAD-binding oxidoreductase [Pedobacter sp. B4-66]|uniref:FAD-dependent oxidoreductase n=1 Tax=Pedobacter sp. B4-66 TaxID=2817280 RepID=UPI001BDA8E2E|nr:FAD-binding oxidoreductase [Pedobacter sp. B4-66]